ncbi:ATP-dependent sacrificial sulfur transferase LarE [Paracidobacterium acidisoli]|uniref:ATP-dependent sacrificial sulfur transferase LarE n=1 Tax=Paracidobacterium acidisoli TaxID=2303751 RepID=A0A372IUD7_9BACT|nr:ATP-dependent sacrificial sulfur transferase LarE [Paracidobacterium acidisoli]MBT9329988.1 ATP-dependent sacrificial sulfur transferase LarE [Paracidobacterium acidisoli]
MTEESADIELRGKEASLRARLRELESLLVAYSGGIDSAYLAWMAHQVLGDRMLAVIADSASLDRSHYRDAVAFAEEQGIPLRTVETRELEQEAYAVNDANRCFHCKDELFTVLEAERGRLGFGAVAYGLNLDDKKDFRPGQRAAVGHQVAAPLADAGLTKAEIRALAKEAELRVWDKPASACLSSRIEYGRRVTPEALRMVEEAEGALRGLGLRNFRVRHHGSVARIEIAEEELAKALNVSFFHDLSRAVRAAGFHYVAVDCDGYRSGSMNELLPLEALTAAPRAGMEKR